MSVLMATTIRVIYVSRKVAVEMDLSGMAPIVHAHKGWF